VNPILKRGSFFPFQNQKLKKAPGGHSEAILKRESLKNRTVLGFRCNKRRYLDMPFHAIAVRLFVPAIAIVASLFCFSSLDDATGPFICVKHSG